MRTIAGYRTMVAKSQKEMAQKLGLSLNGYRQKEKGETEFKPSEMQKFTLLVKEVLPEITLQDIFFNN